MLYFWAIIAYLLILIGVGAYRSAAVRSQDDFMVAGRNLSAKVLIGTLLATWIGSGSIIAGAGLAYERGFAALWFNAGVWIALIVLYFVAGNQNANDQYPVCPYIMLEGTTVATEDSPYTAYLHFLNAYRPGAWNVHNKPGWLSVSVNGTLSGTPDNEDVGVEFLNITINDHIYWFGQMNVSITVMNVNDPPVINMSFLPEQSTEDTIYSATFQAVDIDPGPDTLTWAMTRRLRPR